MLLQRLLRHLGGLLPVRQHTSAVGQLRRHQRGLLFAVLLRDTKLLILHIVLVLKAPELTTPASAPALVEAPELTTTPSVMFVQLGVYWGRRLR